MVTLTAGEIDNCHRRHARLTGADLWALRVEKDTDMKVRAGRGGFADALDSRTVGLVVAVARRGTMVIGVDGQQIRRESERGEKSQRARLTSGRIKWGGVGGRECEHERERLAT